MAPSGCTVVVTAATVAGVVAGTPVMIQVLDRSGAVLVSCTAMVGATGAVVVPSGCQAPGAVIDLVFGASLTAAQPPHTPSPVPVQLPAAVMAQPTRLPKTGGGGGASEPRTLAALLAALLLGLAGCWRLLLRLTAR